jgi:hypothetical protein
MADRPNPESRELRIPLELVVNAREIAAGYDEFLEDARRYGDEDKVLPFEEWRDGWIRGVLSDVCQQHYSYRVERAAGKEPA